MSNSNIEKPNYDHVIERWTDVLEHKNYAKITSRDRLESTALLLDNTQRIVADVNNMGGSLNEDATLTGNIAKYSAPFISMVRRAAPLLIAHDVCGFQPLPIPDTIIFALRARYENAGGKEALFTDVNVNYSGDKSKNSATYDNGAINPFLAGQLTDDTIGSGVNGAIAETGVWNDMSVTVEKINVNAVSRQLKAAMSMELIQDWSRVHGQNAERILTGILGREILVEINQQTVRTIYNIAKPGAQTAQTPGTFNLLQDSDGRYNVERYKGLLVQINRDANRVALETRRGRANVMIASADVVSVLQMTGVLDFSPALNELTGNLSTEMVGSTYAGNIGNMRVYIDPYLQHDGYVVGYRGDQYDAGLFFCPYSLMQPARATDATNFNHLIGLKSRYALAVNPLVGQAIAADTNPYYRKVSVAL